MLIDRDGNELAVQHDPNIETDLVGAPVQRTWNALMAAYAGLAIPVSVVDSGSFVIGNRGFRPRRIEGRSMSRYLDCGSGITALPYADEYEVTMQLMTQLSPQGKTSTTLATRLEASAKARDVSAAPVHCTSRGILEQRLVDLVARAVGDTAVSRR